MNQASKQFNLGYSVYRNKGDTYIYYRGVEQEYLGDVIRLSRSEPIHISDSVFTSEVA